MSPFVKRNTSIQQVTEMQVHRESVPAPASGTITTAIVITATAAIAVTSATAAATATLLRVHSKSVQNEFNEVLRKHVFM